MKWTRQAPEAKDIEGVRWADCSSVFVHRLQHPTVVVRGFPTCPECKMMLARNFTKGCWECAGCGTVWSDTDLVQAIENEDRALAVTIRNLKD